MLHHLYIYRDEAYAETSDGSKHHCWNGQGISEYTQTVVDASATAQRYNPEFGIRQVQDDPQVSFQVLNLEYSPLATLSINPFIFYRIYNIL